MKKLSMILSVGSMALYGTSFLLLMLVTVLQSELVSLFFHGKQVSISVPISQFISVSGMFVLSLIVFLLSRKGHIPVFLNVLLILLPIFIVMPMGNFAGYVQRRVVSTYSVDVSLGYNYVQSLATYAGVLNPLAYGAYLVGCGMRLSGNFSKKL